LTIDVFARIYMTKAASFPNNETLLSVDDLTSPLSASLFAQNDSLKSQFSQGFVGHERAKEALEFGLSMPAVGFNVFALGEHGTGRQTLIKQLLNSLARSKNSPNEWCYINNFDESHIPLTLSLKPGDGKKTLS
jgi:Cdc6-like AAA superfamily ATPase